MERTEALQAAKRAELDLVELSPDTDPPVVKIVDWGKYNYQRTKQLQKSKRKAKKPEIKQMRFGLKISDHDLGVKCRKISEFLSEGDKTKIIVVFRGRELAHKELGPKLVERILNVFGDTVAVDQEPVFAGKQLSFVIRSSHAKVKDT